MGTGCPAADDLGGFLLGKLPMERYEEVGAHLESCPECQARLGQLREASLRFQSRIPDTAACDPFQSEAGCDIALASVGQLLRGLVEASNPTATTAATPAAKDPVQLGPYRILKKLGQGGMGAVYQALHTRLKRLVAIKVLATHRLGDPSALARFQREMEAVGRLQHPHIVAALDANEDQGTHYLVTEYIEGLDLAQLVERCGPLPVPEACALICQAAVGLHYAHGQGLVHRDIKPSNLMLTLDHRTLTASAGTASEVVGAPTALVKILDLGLALLHEDSPGSPELTSEERVMGTLDYMAPEQASDSHHVDIRADIYALGASLFKLLTGQAPMASGGHDTQWKKLLALAGAEAPPIRKVRGDLPAALGTIVGRMLARERGQRPATAQQVADALWPFARGADLTALLQRAQMQESATSMEQGRAGIVERGPVARTRDRKRDLLLGGMLLVAVLVVLAGVILTRGHRAVESSTQQPMWGGWPGDAPPPACIPFSAAAARQAQEAWARHLDLPVIWKNSIGMQFCLIPPGEFVMGSSAAEIDATMRHIEAANTRWLAAIRSEAPQHRVVLTKPYYLGSHEVTQQQYAAVMARRPSYFAAAGPGSEFVGAIGTENHPVETVNWDDAIQFCARLSVIEEDKRLGRDSYRLPTEAEWEFACRAGTSSWFWNGDQEEDLMRTGWFGRNAGYRTHAVGELLANPFGMFDMHGNVWEWTQDAWDANFYGESAAGIAVDPLNRSAGPIQRVIRGGDWNFVAAVCRSGHRHVDPPSSRNRFLGFRVALPVSSVRR